MPMMRRTLVPLSALALAATGMVAPAAHARTGPATAAVTAADGSGFYTEPATLPGADGTLIKAMTRSRDRLKATLDELESRDDPDPDLVDDLREKLRFLDRGIELFS